MEKTVIQIAGVWFEGPFVSTAQIRNVSGVYVVASNDRQPSGQHYWLDVGQSDELKDRLDAHDRAECWQRNSMRGWVYYVSYCIEPMRTRLEQAARAALNPACGVR